MLDVEDAGTWTPGELATHAIEAAELPRGPVETLRDAFREVEYGDRSPADSDEALLAAIEAIERAAAEQRGGENPDVERADEPVPRDGERGGGTPGGAD